MSHNLPLKQPKYDRCDAINAETVTGTNLDFDESSCLVF